MYKFSFASLGGTTRVKITSGEDIRHLGELDKKMWTILSCPVEGLEMEATTLAAIDSTHDGLIHLDEVVATAEWLCSVIDPNILIPGTDKLAVSVIKDETIAAVAKKVAGDKSEVCLADVLRAQEAAVGEAKDAPEPPYAADVMAAFHAKETEYKEYFHILKMQGLGLAKIAEDAVIPGMDEETFTEMGAKIAAFEAESAAVAADNAAATAVAKTEYDSLIKLLRLTRDFYTFLRNYVSLEDFYVKGEKAMFQAGTLVVDQRACHLCLRVNDMAKQDLQAGASGIFLIYCDCINKKMGKTMKIVAAVTVGEIRNLTVGKNAIFYDRQGNDWDATIVKIIDNPISISQAFWSPYRKLGNWVTDLINKRAAEKDSKVFSEATADIEAKADAASAAEIPKQNAFDIAKFAGIFAAIGMAVGMVATAITGIFKSFVALQWWQMIAVIVAIMLFISGPAMIMAYIKLRKRNLAPVLNANGWAVNADAIVNVLFGNTLTDEVRYPVTKFQDPFVKEGVPAWRRWLYAILSVAAVLCCLYLLNLFAFCGLKSPLSYFNHRDGTIVVADSASNDSAAVVVAEEPTTEEQTTTAE